MISGYGLLNLLVFFKYSTKLQNLWQNSTEDYLRRVVIFFYQDENTVYRLWQRYSCWCCCCQWRPIVYPSIRFIGNLDWRYHKRAWFEPKSPYLSGHSRWFWPQIWKRIMLKYFVSDTVPLSREGICIQLETIALIKTLYFQTRVLSFITVDIFAATNVFEPKAEKIQICLLVFR